MCFPGVDRLTCEDGRKTLACAARPPSPLIQIRFMAIRLASSRLASSLASCLLALALLLLSACGGGEGETVAVDSGTYTGTIGEVNPDESEIYVEVPNTGTLELYFTDSTQVTGQSGSSVPFDSLAQGQSVDVTVEKIGQRLNPLSVKINQQSQ